MMKQNDRKKELPVFRETNWLDVAMYYANIRELERKTNPYFYNTARAGFGFVTGSWAQGYIQPLG